MPHIIVTAKSSSGRDVVMLAERVPVRVLEDNRAADQLVEHRRGSADVAKRERPEQK